MRPRFPTKLLGLYVLSVLLLGAACNNNTSLQSSGSTQATSTPEDAWNTFREGWKKGDVNQVMSACAPTTQSQEWCRQLFDAMKAAGHTEDYARDLQQGTFSLKNEVGEIRYYIFVNNGEASTYSFRQFPEVGWKLDE